jgi:two-component system sensor histidine kinase UhpB
MWRPAVTALLVSAFLLCAYAIRTQFIDHGLERVTETAGALAAALVAFVVAMRTASQHKLRDQHDKARREAELRYRTLVEQLPLITYIDSPETSDESAVYVSPQVQTILGYTPEDWCSVPGFFEERIHPDDRERVRTLQRMARQKGEPLDIEYRFRAHDGTYVWLSDSATVVLGDDGLPWYSQGFALDVSARKQAEQDREALLAQAQVQNAQLEEAQRERARLLARTVEVAEEERMRIAAELHDGPIQKLTVVAFTLDRLALRIARNEPGAERLAGEIREGLRAQMDALRKLMSELRPPILDERNLEAALNDCAEQIFADSTIVHETSCRLGDEWAAPEVETAVYRVVREALINVRRHAGATRVHVEIERQGDSLRLLVTDDGAGFDRASAVGPSFGILGMEERIGSVGGQLDVVSSTDNGTRIEATLPWKSKGTATATATATAA